MFKSVDTEGRCTTSYLLAGPACVCDALFCFVFEAQHQTRPASHQAISPPKSSTVADGQHGFHLQTSGDEPLLTDYWFLDPHTVAEPANTSCKLSAEPHNP